MNSRRLTRQTSSGLTGPRYQTRAQRWGHCCIAPVRTSQDRNGVNFCRSRISAGVECCSLRLRWPTSGRSQAMESPHKEPRGTRDNTPLVSSMAKPFRTVRLSLPSSSREAPTATPGAKSVRARMGSSQAASHTRLHRAIRIVQWRAAQLQRKLSGNVQSSPWRQGMDEPAKGLWSVGAK